MVIKVVYDNGTSEVSHWTQAEWNELEHIILRMTNVRSITCENIVITIF